jgi:TM2 domain-containing membrane protein YozV
VIWFFFGILGAHRFYLKSPGVALGQLFTLGGLFIWSFVDVFFIGRRLQQLRSELRREVYAQYGVPIA